MVCMTRGRAILFFVLKLPLCCEQCLSTPHRTALYLLDSCTAANMQDMPGFRLGQKIEGKCGMRASMTAELVFDGVEASR